MRISGNLNELIIAVVVIALLSVGGYFLIRKGANQMRIDNAYGLAGQLAVFCNTHNGHLPENWREFSSWNERQNASISWSEKEFAPHINILWGADVANAKTDGRWISFTDKSLQHSEGPLNGFFRGSVHTSKNGLDR
jgi:hypothetical protein